MLPTFKKSHTIEQMGMSQFNSITNIFSNTCDVVGQVCLLRSVVVKKKSAQEWTDTVELQMVYNLEFKFATGSVESKGGDNSL